ncbi:MAG: hypothetical protein ACJA0S_000537 [Rickettsiales bacterium]|jgi:hypothetical protein
MSKIITIILCLLIISSCSAKTGNKSTIHLYQDEISKGTNLSEIVKNYGAYSGQWEGESGNKIYQYSYVKNSYDLVSLLPIINHFGWVKSKIVEVVLEFDENEKLLQKNNFYSTAKAKNSLVCNPKIYSCIKKIY